MADNSSVFSGALGGAATGAQIGSMLPIPGVGTVVGALGGLALGAISGGKKQKAVDDAMAALEAIPNVDPNQVEFKDQLIREKKMVESGFSTDFQVAKDIIGQSEAGGMSVAAEMAQTNPALALMVMNQVSNQTDTSINKSLGTISTQKMGYTQMISEMIDKIAQRKIDVDLMKATQKLTQASVSKKDFNQNSLASLIKFGPGALEMIPGMGGGVSNMFSGSSGIGNMVGNTPLPGGGAIG
jgi:hypothetical protein